MAVSVAIWSQDLEPNKRNVYTVENDIRISGASLAAELADPNGRTVVEVVIKIPEDYDIDDLPVDEETGERPPMHKFVLCALTGGKIEQQQLDLVLPEGEEIEFVVKGKNPVHLYGNYIQQNPDDDDSDEDSDEDEFDLEDVPSDVEVDLEDEELHDSGRFEEVHEEPAPKSAKRAREDEDMADVSTASAADTSATLSKKEKKRAKKLKNEAGKAAPAPTTTTTAAATTPNGKEKPAEKEAKPVEKKDAKPAEKKDGGKKDGEKKKKSEPKTLPGGVTIEDKTIGTGPAAKAGKKIGMRYIGRLKSGKVFDSNTKGKPFFFTLGAGDVIKGWDEGIPGMLVGGERVLTIPAHKGYGKRGAPPDIPPNAELIFEVKLVEVK